MSVNAIHKVFDVAYNSSLNGVYGPSIARTPWQSSALQRKGK